MTTTDKEAKEFHKTLNELKKQSDAKEDYNSGGAYKAFLKLLKEGWKGESLLNCYG